VERLERANAFVVQYPFCSQIWWATGNYNAHHVAYHKLTGKNLENFVEENLAPLFPTTQIEHYDHFAAFDAKRINTIIIDWTEISGPTFNGIFQTKK
jgi:adenylosuccinate lyase